MARKFTVMGFTEAELGFVLAAFFAAVGVAYQQERAIATDRRTQMEQRAKEAEKARDSILEVHAAVAESLVVLKDSLNITRQKPHCSEKGEPDASVARLAIIGGDRYVIGGDTLPFADVVRRLQPWIARGASLRCIYSVDAVAVRGVDAPVYAVARSRLRAHFNVRDRDR